MPDTVLANRDGAVLELTLNRPDRLNAINRELGTTLLARLDEAEADDTVRVVVLKGAGRAFCSGDEIGGGEPAPPDRRPTGEALAHARRTPYYNIVKKVRGLPKPVIVQAHGYALGAGCDITLAADFAVSAESCRFGLVFVQRAIVGGTFMVTKHVGLKQASRLLLTGDMISAREALDFGLITEVAPDDQLQARVGEWARRLASGATRTIGYLKAGINFGLTHDIDRSLEYQAFMQVFSRGTEDAREGRRSFAEKREAEYRGR